MYYTKKCKDCDAAIGRNSRKLQCRSCYIKNYYSQPENIERRRINQLNFIRRDPAKHRERAISWQKKNVERAREIETKTKCKNVFKVSENRAKRLGHTWSLSPDEYASLRDESCTYCGSIPEANKYGVGLDRLDNSKGYEPDNVVPCCGPCNKIRGDRLTPEEMTVAMQAVLRLRQKNKLRLVLPARA